MATGEREGLLVAVAQREGAKVDDGPPESVFQRQPGREADLKQTLAGGFYVARADRQAEPSRRRIPHVLAVILKVGDGFMHGATVADAHGLL